MSELVRYGFDDPKDTATTPVHIMRRDGDKCRSEGLRAKPTRCKLLCPSRHECERLGSRGSSDECRATPRHRPKSAQNSIAELC